MSGALGSPGYGLNYLGYDPTKTVEYNIAQQRRSNIILDHLTSGQNAAYKKISENATANMLRFMGYDADRAAAEAKNTGGIGSFLSNMFIQPRVRAAAGSMASALYGRSAAWDPNAASTSASIEAQQAFMSTANAWIDTTLMAAANKQFGGMGIEDVGKLAGAYAQLGGFDTVAGIKSPQGKQQRITEINTELQKYAESVNMLRDVIDGPVEKILSSFEKLTGSKLVATATGRVSDIASAMRNVLMDGRIDERGLANMVASQYGLIAPMGGSLMQATAMATASAAAMNYGVRIGGLSDIEFGNALAQDNARMVANGDLRSIAAAYVRWRGKRADTADTKEEFLAEMRKKGGGSLAAQAQAYLAGQNIDAAFMGSALVTGTMADTSFITATRTSYANRYNTARDNIIKRYGMGKYADIINGNYDIADIQDRLMQAGVDANTASQVGMALGSAAMEVTGAATWQTAMATVGSAQGAYNTIQRNLAGDSFRRIRGQISAGGFTGVLDAMMSGNGSPMSVARIIKAAMGIDVGDLKTGGSALALKKIAAATGMSEAQVNDMFTTAAGLGAVGESILFAQGAGLTPQQLVERRQRLLKMVESGKRFDGEDFGEDLTASYADLEAAAKGLGLSSRDIDRAYLTMTGNGVEYSDEEVTSFGKYRTEYGDANAAALRIKAAKKADQIRAEQRRTGGKLDKKTIASKLEESAEFKEYVGTLKKLDKGGDTTNLAYELSTRDGLMGMLQDILDALLSLGGEKPGSKANR